MKIVFLSTYSGPINRGIESWVYEASIRLSKNHNVTVFQLGEPSGKEIYNIKQIKIDINWNKPDSTGKLRRFILLDYYSRMLARFTFQCIPEIRKIKPDIIIPLNGGWQTIICKILSKVINCKLIWVGQFNDPYSLLIRPDLFIAISPNQEKIGIKKYRVNTKLIPNGVDVHKFSQEVNKYQHNLKYPVVLFVGALTYWKNPDKVILAISKTKNMSLLMVGKGDEKYIIMGKKLLKNRFKHFDAKFEDMPQIYKSADVFTLPSDINRETFGLVYLEAMASGLPVVATEDDTRKFIVDKAGLFLSNVNNIDNYSQLLEKALVYDWGKEPLNQAQKFDYDYVISKYENEFKNILNKKDNKI